MFDIEFSRSSDLLYASVSGRLTYHSDHEIDSQIRSYARTHDYKLVLIDIRNCTSRLSLKENIESGKSFKTRMADKFRAIAILDHPENGLNSAVFDHSTRGLMPAVKFFTEESSAETWLRRQIESMNRAPKLLQALIAKLIKSDREDFDFTDHTERNFITYIASTLRNLSRENRARRRMQKLREELVREYIDKKKK